MANIAIVGAGYVGMSLAVLLAKNHVVEVLDIDLAKVGLINNKQSPVDDPDINQHLQERDLHLTATANANQAYVKKDFFIISTPTSFNERTDSFDTSIVESVINEIIQSSSTGLIVIKSTVPVGFTKKMNQKFNTSRVIFSPEFLREGRAVYDNQNPSRIIVSNGHQDAELFTQFLVGISKKKNVDVLMIDASEAEAIKLFANTYLAMRVAFFNELDSFALEERLNTKNIIDGISLDPRIGNYYNNPSFGYGGYCLPKDIKQLLAQYANTPQDLIKAIVSSNETRKNFLVRNILTSQPKIVGIYRLAMKLNSENFRESAILDLVEKLTAKGVEILIYEPLIAQQAFNGLEIENNLNRFKSRSDIIVSNRLHEEIRDVAKKVFTRDVYGKD
ncbi:nucleotide sugar dehydrogenase [Gammaproteobacteria bacterium]|nr:nucleotide sugar dehydrogenase [Gammaproteobacteria bacterium]